jgi:two-component system, OmpR family, phosphate regulon sensor histidine kinase PhoR
METMSHFIHDAGHELKTPLAIISGNLQYVRDTEQLDEKLIDESIETIHSMGDSLNGLLELSQLQIPGELESVRVSDCVQEIVRIYQSQMDIKGIRTKLEIPSDAVVRANANHLRILLSNLVKNAINYNVQDGEIAISYGDGMLTVRDTGIGIGKADLGKIFERFYRVDRSGKYPGTGIGLAIVDRVAKLYGWKVSVESELGKGAAFGIVLK